MQRYWNYARRNLIPGQAASAQPALGATVTVYIAGSLTLATLFADTIGTPKANPFTADLNDAYLDFYAANGHYDVQLSGGVAPNEITTPYVWGDILLADVGTGVGGGVVQAQLGGSQSVSPAVAGTPATVDAINFLDVLIPWTNLPVGAVVALEVYCQVATGASMVAKLFDLTSAAVVLTDPTPFTDDTQFVKHTVILTPVLVDQVVRLQMTVTDGDSLPCFFYGDLLFSL